MTPAQELDQLVSEPDRLLPEMLPIMNSYYDAHINRFSAKPEPEETDPKPITAPWPGEPPTAPPPDTDDGETKVPLVR